MENMIEINELELDKEWIKQPKMYLEHAAKLADARAEMDEAKSALTLVEAEMDLKIRNNPERYEIEKITEKTVQTTIITSARYKETQKEFFEAKHKVDLLSAVVDALEHRKKALENLVHLHCAGYFAEPRANEAGRGTVEDMKKRAARGRR